jgi:hypothetical protein
MARRNHGSCRDVPAPFLTPGAWSWARASTPTVVGDSAGPREGGLRSHPRLDSLAGIGRGGVPLEGSGKTELVPEGSGETELEPLGSGETEPAPLGSGKMEPVPLGSSKTELVPLGSGETKSEPLGPGESESPPKESDGTVVMPLIVRVD